MSRSRTGGPILRRWILGVLVVAGCSCRTTPAEFLDAVRNNDHKAIRSAVASGGKLDPNCAPNMICKPLAVAAEEASPATVLLLLALGADPNGRNAYDDTPLIYALIVKRREVAKLLVEHGANVNQPNAFGISPFMAVCGEGDMNLAKFFLSKGGDVNATFPRRTSNATPEGLTALMLAARGGQAETVTWLLANQADPKARDSTGKDAAAYARGQGHEEVTSLLSEETVKPQSPSNASATSGG